MSEQGKFKKIQSYLQDEVQQGMYRMKYNKYNRKEGFQCLSVQSTMHLNGISVGEGQNANIINGQNSGFCLGWKHYTPSPRAPGQSFKYPEISNVVEISKCMICMFRDCLSLELTAFGIIF